MNSQETAQPLWGTASSTLAKVTISLGATGTGPVNLVLINSNCTNCKQRNFRSTISILNMQGSNNTVRKLCLHSPTIFSHQSSLCTFKFFSQVLFCDDVRPPGALVSVNKAGKLCNLLSYLAMFVHAFHVIWWTVFTLSKWVNEGSLWKSKVH